VVTPDSLTCSPSLWLLLKSKRSILWPKGQEGVSMESFLERLNDIVGAMRTSNKGGSYNHHISSNTNARLILRVVQELSAIGWSHVNYLHPSLRQFHLQIADSTGRMHTMQLALGEDYPMTCPIIGADLPVPIKIQWYPQESNLSTLLTTLRQLLQKCEAYFAICEELHEHAWVLEPQSMQFSVVKRRLALGNHCSVELLLAVHDPGSTVPNLQFLGPSHALSPWKDAWEKNKSKWLDKSLDGLSFLQKLSSLLEQSVPTRQVLEKEETLECAICYGIYVDEQLPEVICENSHCSRAFHQDCIGTYFRSGSETRQSFDTIFGECPYCTAPMSVKVTK
jgi:E3 ubiquitin-protein ligase FANCL